jgi:hypothetical protein
VAPTGRVHLVQEVESLEASLDTSECPAEARVVAVLGHGACDTLLEPEVGRQGERITLLFRVQSGDGVCTAQLVTTTVRVSLGRDFTPGTYLVHAPSESSRVGDATLAVPPCQPGR